MTICFFPCQFFSSFFFVLNCADKSLQAITPVCGQCKQSGRSLRWNIRSAEAEVFFLHFTNMIASGSQGRLVHAVISHELLFAFYYQSFTAIIFLLISLFVSTICIFQLMTWNSAICKGSMTAVAAWPASQKCWDLEAALEPHGRFCCPSFLKWCYFPEAVMPSATAGMLCFLNSIFPTGSVGSSYPLMV